MIAVRIKIIDLILLDYYNIFITIRHYRKYLTRFANKKFNKYLFDLIVIDGNNFIALITKYVMNDYKLNY